jgi:poly(3-hydroxybutyrate) depolymerase
VIAHDFRRELERSLPSRCFLLGMLCGLFVAAAVQCAAAEHWLLAGAGAVAAGLMAGATKLAVALDSPRPADPMAWRPPRPFHEKGERDGHARSS